MASNQGSDNARFEATWAEWIDAQQVVKSLINPELLRNIAGYFYFAGASEGINNARAVLADTVTAAKEK